MLADDVVRSRSGASTSRAGATQAETFSGSMMLIALSSAVMICADRSGSSAASSTRIPHVQKEPFDGPIGDRQLGRPEGIERRTRVVRREQGPVGQVPRRDRIRSRLHEELDWLFPRSLGSEHELAVLVVESLDRPEPGVPDLAFGREADHLVAAEVDEGHHFSTGPRVRDRSPEPEPRGIPCASPGVAHVERGDGCRTASMAGIGSPCRWWADTSNGVRLP